MFRCAEFIIVTGEKDEIYVGESLVFLSWRCTISPRLADDRTTMSVGSDNDEIKGTARKKSLIAPNTFYDVLLWEKLSVPIFVMFKLYDAVACLTSAEIFSTGLLELILAG